MKSPIVSASAIALSLTLLVAPALAAGPKPDSANVIANADCVGSDGISDKDVMITAILEQKEKIGPAPEVGDVTFILEQHIRNRPQWNTIDSLTVPIDAIFPFPTPAAGETVEVADHTFLDICTLLDADANAIRGVVKVEVTNSNPNRNDGQIHTGRCISIPNPCP